MLYIDSVMDWRPVQGVPCLSPSDSWDRLFFAMFFIQEVKNNCKDSLNTLKQLKMLPDNLVISKTAISNFDRNIRYNRYDKWKNPVLGPLVHLQGSVIASRYQLVHHLYVIIQHFYPDKSSFLQARIHKRIWFWWIFCQSCALALATTRSQSDWTSIRIRTLLKYSLIIK